MKGFAKRLMRQQGFDMPRLHLFEALNCAKSYKNFVILP